MGLDVLIGSANYRDDINFCYKIGTNFNNMIH